MGYSDEFPNLHPLGLYAANITGDGNCLFNALSDQLYGNQAQHHEIRRRVVQYMREHKDDYTPFLDVLPGGATRRNPKRKNAATFSSSFDSEMPTPEDIDRAFEDRLRRMGQGGTYGDNFEIVAFTRTFNADVMVFQMNERLFFAGPRGVHQKETCCIAYHTWEHYSSIRNLDGPHTGPPEVRLKELTVEELSRMKTPSTGPINVQQWQIDLVMSSAPWPGIDENSAIKLLEESRGSVDTAVLKLLDADESSDQGRSSSVHSSSVEPQLPADDVCSDGPNKKRDRRMSRNAKLVSRRRERQRREQWFSSQSSTSSLEHLQSSTTPSVESHGQRRRASRVILDDEDTEMDDVDTPPPLDDGSTSSESDYSISISPPKPPITLKLSLKPPTPQPDLSNPPVLPPSRSNSKSSQPKKRLNSARDIKNLKKQAQKQHAKERRQVSAQPKKEQSFGSEGSSQSSVNTGFRLLHV